MATQKAKVRNNFLFRVGDLIAHGLIQYDSVTKLERTFVQAGTPPSGQTHDAMWKEAFSREDNSNDFLAAVSNVQDPGVVGDLIASQLQADYLAMMERAVRASSMTHMQARYQAAARRRGQAMPQGVLTKGVLGYVENLVKASGQQKPETSA